MKKETAKRKIKQKKKQQKYQEKEIYFEIVLMIILIPTIVLFLVPIFQKPLFENTQRQLTTKINKIASRNSVEIITEKNIYRAGDEIVLSIKNNSNSSIYFEPCEYLNNFEKKINGVWVDESSIVKNKIYDSNNFRKGESVTSCRLNLPKLGVGIYRVVVKVYYNCQMPGEATCSNSKTFYSNEFEIEANKDDFCENKILENCDGKKVFVTGTFVISKTQFLSRIEGRKVKYQWDGGIMIDYLNGMKEGERYNVIGIIEKGGQPCRINEQCMLDEKGVALPYPTRIKVEKFYPVK